MASQQELEQGIVAAHKHGDTTSARKLAAELNKMEAAPKDEPFKFGATSSEIVRPLAEGGAGLVTALPDIATSIANMVPPAWLGGEPAIQSPGDAFQGFLDKHTTKPQGMGKVTELIESMLAGGGIGRGASKLLSKLGIVAPAIEAPGKSVSQQVRDLADKKVTMTPGQRAGKESFTGRMEQRAESLPLGGDKIRKARGLAIEDYNRADLDDALKLGKGAALPAMRKGRDALFHVKTELSRRYGEVLGKMHADLNAGTAGKELALPGAVARETPGSFRAALENIRKVGANLDESQRRTLGQIIDDQVLGKFTSAGKASGETVKEIEETLRTEADVLRKGGYQDRKLASALDQIRSDFRGMLKRVNKAGTVSELEGIDKGYAKFQTSAKASRYAKASDGVYSPAQKLRSIEARDTSKNKIKFATGQAPDQKATESAEKVLGNTVPNSGTPERWAVVKALEDDPLGLIASLPASVAISLIYSRPGLKLLQRKALSTEDIDALEKLGVLGGAQQATQGGGRKP